MYQVLLKETGEEVSNLILSQQMIDSLQTIDTSYSPLSVVILQNDSAAAISSENFADQIQLLQMKVKLEGAKARTAEAETRLRNINTNLSFHCFFSTAL